MEINIYTYQRNTFIAAIRIFLQVEGDSSKAKPVRISPDISFITLKEIIGKRLGLQIPILEMTVCGPVEWNIEEDDDVSEISSNEIIRIRIQ